MLIYTAWQLGPALGALSGISGRNCWGGEESHYLVLANALLCFSLVHVVVRSWI